LFVFLVIAASAVARIIGVRKFGRELPPPAWTFSVPVLALVLFFGALTAYSLLAARGGDTASAVIVTLLWYSLTGLGMLAGFIVPLRYVPSADEIRYTMVAGTVSPPSWRLRTGTYINLVQRVWEDQLAALIFAGCAWFILCRIFLGLYPTQLDLLVPGFEEEIKATVSAIASSLSVPGG